MNCAYGSLELSRMNWHWGMCWTDVEKQRRTCSASLRSLRRRERAQCSGAACFGGKGSVEECHGQKLAGKRVRAATPGRLCVSEVDGRKRARAKRDSQRTAAWRAKTKARGGMRHGDDDKRVVEGRNGRESAIRAAEREGAGCMSSMSTPAMFPVASRLWARGSYSSEDAWTICLAKASTCLSSASCMEWEGGAARGAVEEEENVASRAVHFARWPWWWT